ncbi:hypothetical protein AQJ58_23585 [Streptomyces sp. DSM 15324]|nr:hypothetical protein AQJ58_23585 [Streptomyces sp. DSM 15324]
MRCAAATATGDVNQTVVGAALPGAVAVGAVAVGAEAGVEGGAETVGVGRGGAVVVRGGCGDRAGA